MAETTLENPVIPATRPDSMRGWMAAIGETPVAAPVATPGAPSPNALSTTPPEKPAEPKPKAEPKAEPAPEPKVEDNDAAESPEDKWPRTSENFKKMKAAHKEREAAIAAERDAIKKERDELAEKMKTLSSVTDAEEYKQLKKERDEMDKILKTANIRDNPKFKSYFDNKTNAQIDLAKRIVGNEKGEQMAKLLQLPDGDWKNQQIRDFMAEFDVLEQSRIGGVLNSLGQIEQEKQAALQAADKDYESMTAAQKAAEQKAQEEQKKNIANLIERGITAITDPSKGHPAFQKKDGDSNWNSGVEKRLETVKQLLTGTVPPEKIFETAVNAVAYHQVLESHKGLMAENSTLKEQIKALTAAQPALDTNGKSATPNGERPTTIPIKHGSRPMEVTSNWVNEMKRAQNRE